MTAFGWAIGFATAVSANWLLERRRAFRGIRSACYSVEFRLTEDTATKEFHQWSVGVLEAPFFVGVGFLSDEDRKQASEMWCNYTQFNLNNYPEDSLTGNYQVMMGVASATRGCAMHIELRKIISLFERIP